jgi:hypothetical protein
VCGGTLDRKHRAVRLKQDRLGVASQQHLANRRTTAQANDDQIGVTLLRNLKQVLSRLLASRELEYLDVDAAALNLKSRSFYRVTHSQHVLAILVPSAMGRVHEDQLGLTAANLFDGRLEGRLTLR